MSNKLPWYIGGLLLGLSILLAVTLVKPVGVSTQYVITDAIIWNQVDDSIIQKDETAKTGYSSSNKYLNKSGGKYAKNAAKPLNYSFIFVLAMIVGAFISSRMGGDKAEGQEKQMPNVWRERFGDSIAKRYITVFIAGFIVLYGARLAGGCTSGHMMSGIMQTALSGYVFTLGVFAAGIPVAMLMFNKKGN